MKTILTALLLLTATWLPAQLVTNYSQSVTPNVAIPDGSPVGVVQQFAVGGLYGFITNVQVTLDIAGGFNGDLYAYLLGPQGQLAVLLNRSGVTGLNPYGYANPGFNIALSGAAANNIHGYGSGYSTNGSGQVTGTWAADGRNISPYSAGSVFDSASTLANLGVFNNTAANGIWTLFIADLGGGGAANLHNVILTIMTVPEPGTLALGMVAAVAGIFRFRFWLKKKSARENFDNSWD